MGLEGADARLFCGQEAPVIGEPELFGLDPQAALAERKSRRQASSSVAVTGKKRIWSKKRSSQGLPSVKSCVCRYVFQTWTVRPNSW